MTTKTNLTLGQQVRNFGQQATVVAFHPVTGDPILRDADGLQWLADATKCEPVQTEWCHADGLVLFE